MGELVDTIAVQKARDRMQSILCSGCSRKYMMATDEDFSPCTACEELILDRAKQERRLRTRLIQIIFRRIWKKARWAVFIIWIFFSPVTAGLILEFFLKFGTKFYLSLMDISIPHIPVWWKIPAIVLPGAAMGLYNYFKILPIGKEWIMFWRQQMRIDRDRVIHERILASSRNPLIR